MKVSQALDTSVGNLADLAGATLKDAGSFRREFDTLSDQDKQHLFLRLCTDLDSFDTKVRMLLLEECLALKLVSDDNVKELLLKLSAVERATIGEYIGKCLEPCSYLKSFHACWEDLDLTLKKFFLEKFIQERPEGILMVAPLVVFSYAAPRCPMPRQEVESKTPAAAILELCFKDMETAERFVALLPALKDNDLYYGRRIFNETIANLPYKLAGSMTFLLPHADSLIEKGYLTNNDSCLTLILKWIERATPDLYLTQEERTSIKGIKKQAQRISNDPTKPLSHYELPDSFREKIEIIYAKGQERLIAHVYAGASKWKQHVLPEDFHQSLLNVLDYGFPLFTVLPELGLSESHVRVLLSEAVASTSGPFYSVDGKDLKILIDTGFEKEAARALIDTIRSEGSDSHYIESFLKNIASFAEMFSPIYRERIFQAITVFIPRAWCENLEFALTHNIVPVKRLASIVIRSPDRYAKASVALFDGLTALELKGCKLEVSSLDFREQLRNTLTNSPKYIFGDGAAEQIVSKKEKASIITGQLDGPPDVEFLSELLTELDKSEYKPYQNQLRAILMENREIALCILRDNSVAWYRFEELFSSRERLSLVFDGEGRGLDLSYLQAILDSSDCNLLDDITGSAFHFKRVVSAIKDPANSVYLPFFVDALGSAFRRYQNILENDKLPRAKEWRLLAQKQRTEIALGEIAEGIEAGTLGKPFIQYNRAVLEHLGRQLRGVVLRDLHGFVSLFPEEIIKLKGHVSREEFSQLIVLHARALAHDSSVQRYLKDLAQETNIVFRRLNPLLDLEETKILKDDFYNEALRRFAGYEFFPLYESKLAKIASREQELHGKRMRAEYVHINSEFGDLAHKLSILSSSALLMANKDFIFSTTPKRREDLFEIVLFLGRYNLDDTRSLEITEENFDVVLDTLKYVMKEHIAKIFEVDDLGSAALDNFDVETLNALVVYYKGTVVPHPELAAVFKNFIADLSKGSYVVFRSWGQESLPEEGKKAEYLKKLQDACLIPHRLSLSQYETWIGDEGVALEETLQINSSDIRTGIRRILENAIADGHIPDASLDVDLERTEIEYESLMSPLKEKMMLLDRIKETHEAEAREIKNWIADYREEKDAEIQNTEARLYLARLMKITDDELRLKVLYHKKKSKTFKDVFKSLLDVYGSRYPEFVRDIETIRSMLHDYASALGKEANLPKAKLRISDAVDLKDYLLIGARPVQTCQHYNSSGSLNRGLLSYVIDPNVKIVTIKGEAGELIARGVLRLLQERDGTPALFLERIYSVNPNEKVSQGIVSLARTKAKRLGVSLYTTEEIFHSTDESALNSVNLFNKGSRSPYVYSDAGAGLRRNGLFEVSNAYPL